MTATHFKPIIGMCIKNHEKKWLEYTVKKIIFQRRIIKKMIHKITVATHPSFLLKKVKKHHTSHHLLYIITDSLLTFFLTFETRKERMFKLVAIVFHPQFIHIGHHPTESCLLDGMFTRFLSGRFSCKIFYERSIIA